MLEAPMVETSSLLPIPEEGDLKERFANIKPLLTDNEAVIEASRCLFCHDAPCITACPTSIDIPMFIRQIMSKNPKGSAKTIFTQNIMGKSCGSVCPTQVLCEGACVYNDLNEKPIDIGRLQAYATDHAIQNNIRFFHKGSPTGKKVAVVGGGPAGLACAHELTALGHNVTVYEASEKAGGLNAYGVAPYKFTNTDAQKEVDYVTRIGFNVVTNTRVVTANPEASDKAYRGKTLQLSDLERDFDAVFLGLGLGQSKRLGIPGEQLANVYGAAEFIYHLREQDQKIQVGQRVIVVGAGNTAIDAAVESAKLGADVTLVYRRSEKDQSAYDFEVAHAKLDQVKFLYLTSPVEIEGSLFAEGLRCIKNELLPADTSGKSAIRPIPGSEFTIPCEMIIIATGQEKMEAFYRSISGVTLNNGKIAVNKHFQTGNPKYFAGGDCVNGGKEVVNAVAHGRDAARGIHQYLVPSATASVGG
jgi:dihydropyrimidine dehydrogenase (NAD+) subunit PreT